MGIYSKSILCVGLRSTWMGYIIRWCRRIVWTACRKDIANNSQLNGDFVVSLHSINRDFSHGLLVDYQRFPLGGQQVGDGVHTK